MSVDLSDIFGRDRDILIGMVHVGALPGTPENEHDPLTIIEQAVEEACILQEAGFDAVMVENMHDRPYKLREVGPEIIACMTGVTSAVRCAIDLPLGVQILAGANQASLATAHASTADFIRAEGFCYATVADEGIMDEADAGPLLRFRRMIDAEHIAILADIRKKHSSHSITGDLTIGDWAHTAEFMGADGVIITGSATGMAADLQDATDAGAASKLPVFVGSGVTPENLRSTLDKAHGAIVGSSIKSDGQWQSPVDPDRAAQLIAAR